MSRGAGPAGEGSEPPAASAEAPGGAPGAGAVATTVRPRVLLLAAALAVVAHLAAAALPFPAGTDPMPGRMALAVTVFVATCWLGQGMPLGAASLLPLVLFPVLGVQPTGVIAPLYAHPILWLFFGGFVLALAIEKHGLHRRIALNVLRTVGPRPRQLVLGFLAAGLVLSMWINNTSTSLMLLPIGWALVDRVHRDRLLPPAEAGRFGVCIMLAIGYGCTVGGMGTPIGTAPNALFFSNYGMLVDERGAPPFSFLAWLIAFAPFALLLGAVVWWWLTRVAQPLPREPMEARELLEEARRQAPMSAAERRVLGLFLTAVVLWVTRGDLDLGGTTIRGWASRIAPGGDGGFIADGTVAVAVGILAFLVPAGTGDGRRIMGWEDTRRLPWEILFLLGGGIAIAEAFKATGTAGAFGALLGPVIGESHPLVTILVVALAITFLTEVTSNTAITSLMLPVLMAAALASSMDPRLVMLPATLAASCAFMFPIATPPNAVVFSAGYVTFAQMARAGIGINLLAIGLLTLFLWFVALPLLGIDPAVQPEWMR